MSDTPELDRQSEIIASGKPEIVQEFIDWMFDEKGWVLAEPRSHDYMPLFMQREQLMADFFGIDRDKIEAERRMLLSQVQNANLGRTG